MRRVLEAPKCPRPEAFGRPASMLAPKTYADIRGWISNAGLAQSADEIRTPAS